VRLHFHPPQSPPPAATFNRRQHKEWARDVTRLGLVKQLISSSDRDSAEGRVRGIGITLSAHRDETFTAETDSATMRFRLEKRRARFGGESQVRYRFVEVSLEPLQEDPE
jgi:serine/threonine protein kinase